MNAEQQPSIRRFQFVRSEDVSGISGVGVVAEGVEWTDGCVTVRWLSHTSSYGIFNNMKAFTAVHGHGGAGEVVWLDPEPGEEPAPQPKKRTAKK